MDNSKACNDCKQIKPLSEFHRNQKNKDGRHSYCKFRLNERGRRYRLANPETVKETNKVSKAKNKEKAAETRKIWRKKNRNKINQQKRILRQKNLDHYRKLSREQYERNPASSLNSAARRYSKLKASKLFIVKNNEFARLKSQPCIYCGSRLLIEIDHVIPINTGLHCLS